MVPRRSLAAHGYAASFFRKCVQILLVLLWLRLPSVENRLEPFEGAELSLKEIFLPGKQGLDSLVLRLLLFENDLCSFAAVSLLIKHPLIFLVCPCGW